jgi:hypothetical protein
MEGDNLFLAKKGKHRKAKYKKMMGKIGNLPDPTNDSAYTIMEKKM